MIQYISFILKPILIFFSNLKPPKWCNLLELPGFFFSIYKEHWENEGKYDLIKGK